MASFPQRVLCLALAFLIVFNPLAAAAAGGITVDPKAPASKQPGLDAAPNGVPVVNIVKPNGSGVSHNLYDQFNVGTPGVILNNSNKAGVSQLGGAIAGNPNFGGGAEARLIINEVTGSSRSLLEGHTEIFGYKADYILANPNGITVNGGGFINTPKATLSTGVPRLDGAGALQALEVRKGDVLIDGLGLNAANLDAFEIITRSARINAALYASKLDIRTGYGDYSPATGAFSAAAPDGSAPPAMAIDSSALGGMYAGRITLVGTEKGVGVNMDGTARATDQLTLTSDGKIQVKGTVSSDKDAAVTSLGGAMEISGKLGAGGTASVNAAQELRLAAQPGGGAPLLYGSSVSATAGSLANVDGKILADTALTVTTTGDANNAGTISSGASAAIASGGKLSNTGQIQAASALTVSGQGGVENSGSIQSGGTLSAGSGSGLTNSGTIQGQGAVSAQVTGALDNSGTLYAGTDGTFQAGSLMNRAGGTIQSQGDAVVDTEADLSNSGTITAGGTATLRTKGSLANAATGQVQAQSGIAVESQGSLDNSGTFSSGGTGAYNVTGLMRNSGTISSVTSGTYSVGSLTNEASGQILSQGDGLVSVGGDLTNSGLLFAGGKATYRVGGTLLNNRGQFLSLGDMLLEGVLPGSRMAKLQNDSGGIETLNGGMVIRAQVVENNNLDFSFETGAIPGGTLQGGMHSYGNDAWGVPTIFIGATGHNYDPSIFQWNAKRISTDQLRALGLDAARNVFSLAELTAAVAKAEQELQVAPDSTRQAAINGVKSTIIAAQAPYSVQVLTGQRGEIVVYEATTATDRATGLDKGGNIAASSSITIDASQVKNNVSKISTSTGDISINADTFANVGQEIYERTSVKWGRGFTNNSKNKGVYPEGNGQETILTPVGYAYGTISAGGKVSISADHVSNGIVENAGVTNTVTPPGIIAPPKPGALGPSLPSIDDLFGTLPKNSLFSVNTAPGQRYLVETNPALTSMATFYGSDYFLSRAGIDLNKTHQQLLGDAFYENRLVREQIFALTGQRYLSASVASDSEQMLALMDGALQAQKDLNLSVGVALTKEQIAALTTDIVWLEKKVVDGHEVLAPVVYLSSASLEKIAKGGSVIIGKDVVINTTGDTVNSGVIKAANGLAITAENIFNPFGTMQGQNIALLASNDITNTSGRVAGGDVSLVAGRNIVSDTATTTFRSSNTTSQVANKRGSIEATGKLNMQAGDTVSIVGSDVSAGGAASIAAGKDVVIAAQQTTSDFSTSDGSRYRASSSVVSNQAATVTTGGELTVTAGQDVVIHGSKVQAGSDATLSAGRNLSVTSATDSTDVSASIQSKGGGFFGGKSSTAWSVSQTTNVGSQVSAGGKLTAEAGKAGAGDLVVVGSKVGSGSDMSLKATGDVLVASAENTSSSSYNNSDSGLLSSKSKAQGASSTTQVGSEIVSGGTLVMDGDKGVTVSASTVHGEGDVTLKSGSGDVRVMAAQNESSSYSNEKKSGVGLFADKGRIDVARAKETRSRSSESGNVGSSVTSGHNVNIQAANDASVVGSNVAASNDVNLSAGRDVNIVPGRNARQSETRSKTSGIGIGYSLSENEASLSAGYKSTEKGESSSGQYNAKSMISAGNDVNIQAGRNVNQVSSDVEAGRDVKTTAGQDINVMAAQDVEHLEQYTREMEIGVKAAVKQSVSTAVRTVAELPQAATAGKGSDAAKAVTAASAGLQAVSSVSQALNSSASASLTAGLSVSESRSRSDSATAVPSTIHAGRNVEQTAGRDLTIEGARVRGEKDVTLTAGRDVTITAAQNQSSSSRSSSSASASAGFGASAGVKGVSAGVQVSATLSGSDGHSQSHTHTNADVSAGETLTVKSGQDTTVAGATLKGKNVKMDVGRDLTVKSLQDTASSSSSNYSASATVTVGPVPGVKAETGSSASAGGGSGTSSKAWVHKQTSIIGTESVDIRTERNTHVEGAVIAAENNNLKLDTSTLTHKDIYDHDTGSNTQVSVSAPLSVPGAKDGQQDDSSALAKVLGASTASASHDSHDRQQVNRATIGEGTIIIRSDPKQGLEGLNRDLKKAQELTKDSQTSVKVYIDPAAIKEVASGFKGITKDVGKLLDGIEKILPPELKPQILSIRWANQELLKAGFSEAEAWRLANEPTVRVWLQTERAGQALIEKYGSVQNIPEDARQAYAVEFGRHYRSESINLSGLITESAITLNYVPGVPAMDPGQAGGGGGAGVVAGSAMAAILRGVDWNKIADSAGEGFRNMVDSVRKNLPGYGDTGSKPDTSLPPSKQTTENTAPGGTADNSGAVKPLPGGASVNPTPEDFILSTPGIQKTAQDYIFLQVNTVYEPKIERQMIERGWTKEGVQDLIDNPVKVYEGRDTRRNNDGLTRRDDPATIYVDGAGRYVVRNDVDGTIVQVSDRSDLGWLKPWEKK